MDKNETSSYVQTRLLELQDSEYRKFQAKLIPGVPEERIIGIRTPALRKFAAEFSKDEKSACFLDILPHEYYEENNLHGFLIEKIKSPEECMALLDRFLPFVDNWATCDSIRPKAFRKCGNELRQKALAWMNSGETYTVRYGIGVLMSWFLDEKFCAEDLDYVLSVHSGEYYVNMMRAWYFATALAKQEKPVLSLIESKSLDQWTHNKTIQKACESYRIPSGLKDRLRSLKV